MQPEGFPHAASAFGQVLSFPPKASPARERPFLIHIIPVGDGAFDVPPIFTKPVGNDHALPQAGTIVPRPLWDGALDVPLISTKPVGNDHAPPQAGTIVPGSSIPCSPSPERSSAARHDRSLRIPTKASPGTPAPAGDGALDVPLISTSPVGTAATRSWCRGHIPRTPQSVIGRCGHRPLRAHRDRSGDSRIVRQSRKHHHPCHFDRAQRAEKSVS